MPTLNELLAQHKDANERYNKLFVTQKVVAQKLQDAAKVRTAVRRGLHEAIGVLPVGSLVMTLNGTRFFEITNPFSPLSYHYAAAAVYRHNGELKMEGKGTPHSYHMTRPIEAGSIVPVPPTNPVYLKWHKRKIRDKLEGKE